MQEKIIKGKTKQHVHPENLMKYPGGGWEYYWNIQYLVTCSGCDAGAAEINVGNVWERPDAAAIDKRILATFDKLQVGDPSPFDDEVYCGACRTILSELASEDYHHKKYHSSDTSDGHRKVYVYVKPNDETENKKWRSRNGKP